MNTKVINMFGGPGSGKSRTAAYVYSKLKSLDINCELVREYVKKWAWEDILPNKYDQLYITGKQSKTEHMLFGKVDYIITDCPLHMGVFYEQKYYGTQIVEQAVNEFIKLAESDGIEYVNFMLRRESKYNESGRFASEEEARNTDIELRQYLNDINVPYVEINRNDLDVVYKTLNIEV